MLTLLSRGLSNQKWQWLLRSSSTSSSSSSRESRIVCKPNTTSQIWKHFGLECDDSGKPINADQVICCICDVVVRTKGGSTKNLYTHLKKHHPLKYSETGYCSKGRNKLLSSSTQSSIQEAFSNMLVFWPRTWTRVYSIELIIIICNHLHSFVTMYHLSVTSCTINWFVRKGIFIHIVIIL